MLKSSRIRISYETTKGYSGRWSLDSKNIRADISEPGVEAALQALVEITRILSVAGRGTEAVSKVNQTHIETSNIIASYRKATSS